MKSWMKITLLVVVIFIAVWSFYYLMFSGIFTGAPPVSQHSYLELNIYGDVPEREVDDAIARIFVEETPSMEGLLQNIGKARIDPKIDGIILRPLGSDIGWAKTEDLRKALFRFKETGKPVYVYLETAGNKEYYLASAGSMLFGPPTGNLFITGLLGGSYFAKGTLDKLGIEADFVAHGKYKNAPDIFTRKDMSDPQREVINSILDDYFPRYVKAITDARKLDQANVEKLIDRGLFSMEDAYDNGLLDSLMYFNEFKDYLKQKAGHRVRMVSYGRYKKVPLSKLGAKAKETIALIYGVGDIVSGIGEVGQQGLITSGSMANSIRKAAKDDNIKAIVMRIDSPGGSGTASDIIWREVVQARTKKPVIVSMSDVAASGGYYISLAADSIVAEPSSIVGSIGVFAGKFSFKGLYGKLGIEKQEISRGSNADLFSELDNFSPGQRKLLEQNIDEFYRIFVNRVAEGRHMSYADVDAIAQGRVWTGAQGLKNGLVDKLGGLHEAMQIAKKMIGLPADAYVNVEISPKRQTVLERLLAGSLDSRISIADKMVPLAVQNFIRGFLHFRDGEALYVMPMIPDIR